MIKKQFTLYLQNRPGVLARVTKTLADLKVNLEGISVSESTDVGLVQIVADDAAAAKRALKKANVTYEVQDVSVLPLVNRPGSLSRVIEKLAEARINVNYVYATACACSSDCSCYVVIGAPDLRKVEKAWRIVSKP